ncbi:MAG: glucose 1-dehydrogenase [Austwickia sp.]|jgi:glucose 1-dehydrogenase|nr:MAG: glucose 1-dehydrogenase [Austwickia sp.]
MTDQTRPASDALASPRTSADADRPAHVSLPTSDLLAGKTVVVTGGNTGIGAAIAEAAGAAGGNVVIDYVVHPELNADIAAEIEGSGGKAVAVQDDVSVVARLEDLVARAVATYGRLDVFVNNAGIETRQSLLETTEADYDRVMGIDLKGAYFGAQLAAKQFVAQGGGGVIVNISSVHEDWPMPGNTAYCVAKGGMRMLTRTAGVELGAHGIRMVGVAPGAVDTPINASTMADAEKTAKLNAAIPMGRVAAPEEIAAAVVFVASDAASYMTATTMVVDGGIMQGSVGL